MAVDKYAMDLDEVDDIMNQANAVGGSKAMADGVTYKQGMSLDNAGYHSWATINPATNQDTPAEKVQRWFTEAEEWKGSSGYPFGGDAAPVAGAPNANANGMHS